MATQDTAHSSTLPGVDFEVDRFEWTAGDRLEVTGRWFGVRGRRFVRPVLNVQLPGGRRRLIALLEHKPWAPDEGRPWIAAFAWAGEQGSVEAVELEVGSSLTVDLPLPRGGRPVAQQEPLAPRLPARSAGQREELEALRAEVARLRGELAARPQGRDVEAPDAELAAAREAIERMRAELASARTAGGAPSDPGAPEPAGLLAARDEAVAQRDRAVAARDMARAERDAAVGARDDALAARDSLRDELAGAAAELDAARAERDGTVAKLDAARAERDGTVAKLDAVRAERDRAAAELDAARAERDRAAAELDAARAERDGTTAELDAARAERDHAVNRTVAAEAARDAIGLERDQALSLRDRALAERDAALTERDAAVRARDNARRRARRAATGPPAADGEREAQPPPAATPALIVGPAEPLSRRRPAKATWALRLVTLVVLAAVLVALLALLRGVV